METLGMKIEYFGPDEFGDKWNTDSHRLKKVVNETGIVSPSALPPRKINQDYPENCVNLQVDVK